MCDSEDEANFDFANPIVGEMFASLQRHCDIYPMHTSILIRHGYMEELNKGNPLKCNEIFCMTRLLLLHLVDELSYHGYLRDGQGDVNATHAVAMVLYILGHNTHRKCVADKFQHSTKTVSSHFYKALRAIHSYTKHLIKPNPNVVGLPEHLQVNKYWPWFKV